LEAKKELLESSHGKNREKKYIGKDWLCPATGGWLNQEERMYEKRRGYGKA